MTSPARLKVLSAPKPATSAKLVRKPRARKIQSIPETEVSGIVPVTAPAPVVVEAAPVVPAPVKAPKVARVKKAPVDVSKLSIPEQVEEAFKRKNLLATCIGLILGGFVPFAVYRTAHGVVDFTAPWSTLQGNINTYIALGGMIFSALTVFKWGKMAFRCKALKATGFVVLIEGVMTFSPDKVIQIFALGLLITINAIAAGCILSRRGVVEDEISFR